MGVHVKADELRVDAPSHAATGSAGDGGYRAARWSPLSLCLTALVQAVPVVIGLWIWQPALVQVAPSAPLAVFDMVEPEAPAMEPPPEPEQPVDMPSEPSPAPVPVRTETAPAPPLIAIPAAVAVPTKAMPPVTPPAPPPRPAPSAPSQAPADWQSRVLGQLNAVKAYPASARARRQQGVAMIRFTLDRRGIVLAVALAQSSGFALLDREALALPKRASPLPSPPDDVKGERIELVVPVEFHF